MEVAKVVDQQQPPCDIKIDQRGKQVVNSIPRKKTARILVSRKDITGELKSMQQ